MDSGLSLGLRIYFCQGLGCLSELWRALRIVEGLGKIKKNVVPLL